MGERTDRELLELAAKAAGYRCYRHGDGGDFAVKSDPMYGWKSWAPLTDDGDALRLAVKLGMEITVDLRRGQTWADIGSGRHLSKVVHGGDPGADTRRAITLTAADFGSFMKIGKTAK